MSTDRPPINELFHQHLAEVEFWQSVASAVGEELREIVRSERVVGKVEARAKTTGSVIGKAYRKPAAYSTLDAFPDLAGARVLVPFHTDVEPVALAVHRHPDLSVAKDEPKLRAPDELRYQARHLDVYVGEGLGLVMPAELEGRPIACEIQIQTFAQNLWANMSHLVTYKRDLPPEIHSRVNRLVVLCELFDDEALGSRTAAFAHVDAIGQIAELVQHYFYGITGQLHDPDQAIALIGRLLDALEPVDQNNYESVLDPFVSSYGARLAQLLTDRPEARGLHWLLRPEVILILERLTNAPARLRAVWASEFPPHELVDLEAAWGPTAP